MKKAIELDPYNYELHKQRGDYLRYCHCYDKAVMAYRKAEDCVCDREIKRTLSEAIELTKTSPSYEEGKDLLSLSKDAPLTPQRIPLSNPNDNIRKKEL